LAAKPDSDFQKNFDLNCSCVVRADLFVLEAVGLPKRRQGPPYLSCDAGNFGKSAVRAGMKSNTQKKVNVYLPSLMMKVPDHLYV
jgi:hypothetical protein